MIRASKGSETELLGLIPSIKHYMNEWQIVSVRLISGAGLTQDEAIAYLMSQYRKQEGIIYPVAEDRIVMLVRLGEVQNYSKMKAEIEKTIPGHACRVMLRKMNAAGLKQVQVDLFRKSDGVVLMDNMYEQRVQRRENIIMVVDDDGFVRKSISKLLALFGETVEVEDGKRVLSMYLEHNPDVLFLDIHMPYKSGLDLIPEILEIDPDAYIVTLSADSMKENVLESLEKGAAGFLSKPPARQKVEEYVNNCITIK